MKSTLFALAASAAMLTAGSSAQAGGLGCLTPGYGNGLGYQVGGQYLQGHTQFVGGIHHQRHIVGHQLDYVTVLPHTVQCFTHYRMMPQFGCKVFFSPQHRDWFYFYPQRRCYVPVRYFDRLRPNNLNFNNNLNDNDNFNTNDNRNNNQNVTNINIGPGLVNGKALPIQGGGPIAPIGPGVLPVP